uniref:Dynein light chain n=1 Tax=Panagrellus redivivus TaxID=6233 RepID=A0A7E4VVQ0_PANRE
MDGDVMRYVNTTIQQIPLWRATMLTSERAMTVRRRETVSLAVEGARLGRVEGLLDGTRHEWRHWNCLVGRDFGAYVQHEPRTLAFFYVDRTAVMIFKAK